MDKLTKFEQWAQRTYRPNEAPWKRPALFILCIIILASCAITAYAYINHHWENSAILLIIVPSGLLSIIGLFISIKCKDFWVALILGSA